MRHYEFSYTTTATGRATQFTIPDATDPGVYDYSAIDEDVARAIRAALRRVTTIENVSVTRVADERVTSRDAVSPDPA